MHPAARFQDIYVHSSDIFLPKMSIEGNRKRATRKKTSKITNAFSARYSPNEYSLRYAAFAPSHRELT